jgi:lycopene cyclase domain-containing protein
VPGLYLAAILVSAAGVAAADLRWRLALPQAPGRTVLVTAMGTVFFLAWDAVGIATGVFLKGDSPLLIGIDLAPHLPVEEPVFLAFLSYLTLVLQAAGERMVARRRDRMPETATR